MYNWTFSDERAAMLTFLVFFVLLRVTYNMPVVYIGKRVGIGMKGLG